ncbi:MAG: ribose-phosphate pyrophosphokinase [Sulfobacillus thermosulfidooxidans]|uniref:ribose-phosphate diphosphokinase n=1 Tax=Sulfobacillus TaxID=28033 RepID=UPI000CD02D38|nr:ribose-phosphate pyrophosphokinase [Sulfobacillus sp. hq2]POB10855.1 ribose-phosphate pyrophosphokinase [Sulfobacillus sp. hq2]PSR36851.1 MAG: ribose-phosphate pyrophosphokinase [Sulfobacillus thermosulfidooxidans]
MFEREGPIKLLSGTANRALSEDIARHLGIALTAADVGRFANGEIRIRILDNVRGCDVFILQPTSFPVNDNLMELLLLIDAARRASARRVTAVTPFYGYSRQDRKERGREPISAKLVANLMATAGAHRLLTIDLHMPQLQGFFDIPVDNLQSAPTFATALRKKELDNLMIVSPDARGVHRARQMAKMLGAPLGFIDKRITELGMPEVVHVIGNVKNRRVVILDDLIDTGKTVARAVQSVSHLGATAVYVAATHPVLSGSATALLSQLPLEDILLTDTIPIADLSPNMHIISMAPLLAEAIMRIHENLSVSSLFDV